IHRILLKNNLAYEDEKKKRPRKKWIRYERKHSLSLLHMDWHTSEYNGKQVLIIMDYSSRKILAGGEFNDQNRTCYIINGQCFTEILNLDKIREVLKANGFNFIK
ncbi:MAG: IS481 family transposase, partial [Thermoplasmata archaeon]